MKYERFLDSSFYKFCEKLFLLIILNMITFLLIILGLGVFTLMPALVSLILIIKSSNHNNSIPIVKTYFLAFKKYYKKSFLLSLFYIFLMALFAFNTYYHYCFMLEINEGLITGTQQIYYYFAYYFTLFVDVVLILAFINACFVFVYFPHLSIWKMIKYSFKLLMAVTYKAIILFVLLIGFIYLGVWLPVLLPLILISLYCYIGYLLLNSDYTKVLPVGYKSLDAQDLVDKDRRSPKDEEKIVEQQLDNID